MDNFKNILQAISTSNPKSEVEIFDNNGRPCRAIDRKNGEEFKRHFKIYHNKSSVNRKSSYWTTIKLLTSTSVKSIRNHETVNKLLKQTSTRLRYSEWTDSEQDAQISTIGFLLKYDPKNCPSKQAESEINALITELTGTTANKIPRWKTVMTSTTNHYEGKIHQNLSYDITCRTSDRYTLLQLLQATFKRKRFTTNPIFCPYLLRYKNPKVFNSFVDWHADHCANLMTVAIENIPREHMRGGFDKELCENHPEISVIYEHRNTDKTRKDNVHIPIGRWNIMVKREHFNKLAIELRDGIKSEYDQFLHQHNPTNNYGIHFCPEVTSKLRSQEINSDDGCDVVFRRYNMQVLKDTESVSNFLRTQ